MAWTGGPRARARAIRPLEPSPVEDEDEDLAAALALSLHVLDATATSSETPVPEPASAEPESEPPAVAFVGNSSHDFTFVDQSIHIHLQLPTGAPAPSLLRAIPAGLDNCRYYTLLRFPANTELHGICIAPDPCGWNRLASLLPNGRLPGSGAFLRRHTTLAEARESYKLAQESQFRHLPVEPRIWLI